MIPTLTYFKRALSHPELNCKRLKHIVPKSCNNEFVIRCTHSAYETEVIWEGREYLLYLPLNEQHLVNIEQLEFATRERSRGPLIENRILYDEISLVDAWGHIESFTVILQEISYGTPLSEVASHYKADDLRLSVENMKSRLDAIGFRHNNLTPSNILICKSGTARPLRYWHAEWFDYTDNNISAALSLIEQNRYAGSCPLINTSDEECEEDIAEYGSIFLHKKYGRYGFVDSDGRQVTPFIYSWASPFCEGRAIVAKNNKMGAIDCYGAKIIPVIYKSLEFDIETGTFSATNDKYQYLIDYNGKIICRTPITESICKEIATCKN